jgi:hypothetical protein
MVFCYRCESELGDDPLERLILRNGTVAWLTEADARCCHSCWQLILEEIRARDAARLAAARTDLSGF